MTSINERAERIFKNLISDPYWQGSQGKSREEVVRQEAQQRARQAHNNDLALSMAVSKSGAVKSLMQFLLKAEELDVSEKALQRVLESDLPERIKGIYEVAADSEHPRNEDAKRQLLAMAPALGLPTRTIEEEKPEPTPTPTRARVELPEIPMGTIEPDESEEGVDKPKSYQEVFAEQDAERAAAEAAEKFRDAEARTGGVSTADGKPITLGALPTPTDFSKVKNFTLSDFDSADFAGQIEQGEDGVVRVIPHGLTQAGAEAKRPLKWAGDSTTAIKVPLRQFRYLETQGHKALTFNRFLKNLGADYHQASEQFTMHKGDRNEPMPSVLGLGSKWEDGFTGKVNDIRTKVGGSEHLSTVLEDYLDSAATFNESKNSSTKEKEQAWTNFTEKYNAVKSAFSNKDVVEQFDLDAKEGQRTRRHTFNAEESQRFTRLAFLEALGQARGLTDCNPMTDFLNNFAFSEEALSSIDSGHHDTVGHDEEDKVHWGNPDKVDNLFEKIESEYGNRQSPEYKFIAQHLKKGGNLRDIGTWAPHTYASSPEFAAFVSVDYNEKLESVKEQNKANRVKVNNRKPNTKGEVVRNKLNQMFGLIQGLNTSRALEAGFSSDDAVAAAERVWASTEDAGPNPTVVEKYDGDVAAYLEAVQNGDEHFGETESDYPIFHADNLNVDGAEKFDANQPGDFSGHWAHSLRDAKSPLMQILPDRIVGRLHRLLTRENDPENLQVAVGDANTQKIEDLFSGLRNSNAYAKWERYGELRDELFSNPEYTNVLGGLNPFSALNALDSIQGVASENPRLHDVLLESYDMVQDLQNILSSGDMRFSFPAGNQTHRTDGIAIPTRLREPLALLNWFGNGIAEDKGLALIQARLGQLHDFQRDWYNAFEYRTADKEDAPWREEEEGMDELSPEDQAKIAQFETGSAKDWLDEFDESIPDVEEMSDEQKQQAEDLSKLIATTLIPKIQQDEDLSGKLLGDDDNVPLIEYGDGKPLSFNTDMFNNGNTLTPDSIAKLSDILDQTVEGLGEDQWVWNRNAQPAFYSREGNRSLTPRQVKELITTQWLKEGRDDELTPEQAEEEYKIFEQSAPGTYRTYIQLLNHFARSQNAEGRYPTNQQLMSKIPELFTEAMSVGEPDSLVGKYPLGPELAEQLAVEYPELFEGLERPVLSSLDDIVAHSGWKPIHHQQLAEAREAQRNSVASTQAYKLLRDIQLKSGVPGFEMKDAMEFGEFLKPAMIAVLNKHVIGEGGVLTDDILDNSPEYQDALGMAQDIFAQRSDSKSRTIGVAKSKAVEDWLKAWMTSLLTENRLPDLDIDGLAGRVGLPEEVYDDIIQHVASTPAMEGIRSIEPPLDGRGGGWLNGNSLPRIEGESRTVDFWRTKEESVDLLESYKNLFGTDIFDSWAGQARLKKFAEEVRQELLLDEDGEVSEKPWLGAVNEGRYGKRVYTDEGIHHDTLVNLAEIMSIPQSRDDWDSLDSDAMMDAYKSFLGENRRAGQWGGTQLSPNHLTGILEVARQFLAPEHTLGIRQSSHTTDAPSTINGLFNQTAYQLIGEHFTNMGRASTSAEGFFDDFERDINEVILNQPFRSMSQEYGGESHLLYPMAYNSPAQLDDIVGKYLRVLNSYIGMTSDPNHPWHSLYENAQGQPGVLRERHESLYNQYVGDGINPGIRDTYHQQYWEMFKDINSVVAPGQDLIDEENQQRELKRGSREEYLYNSWSDFLPSFEDQTQFNTLAGMRNALTERGYDLPRTEKTEEQKAFIDSVDNTLNRFKELSMLVNRPEIDPETEEDMDINPVKDSIHQLFNQSGAGFDISDSFGVSNAWSNLDTDFKDLRLGQENTIVPNSVMDYLKSDIELDDNGQPELDDKGQTIPKTSHVHPDASGDPADDNYMKGLSELGRWALLSWKYQDRRETDEPLRQRQVFETDAEGQPVLDEEGNRIPVLGDDEQPLTEPVDVAGGEDVRSGFRRKTGRISGNPVTTAKERLQYMEEEQARIKRQYDRVAQTHAGAVVGTQKEQKEKLAAETGVEPKAPKNSSAITKHSQLYEHLSKTLKADQRRREHPQIHPHEAGFHQYDVMDNKRLPYMSRETHGILQDAKLVQGDYRSHSFTTDGEKLFDSLPKRKALGEKEHTIPATWAQSVADAYRSNRTSIMGSIPADPTVTPPQPPTPPEGGAEPLQQMFVMKALASEGDRHPHESISDNVLFELMLGNEEVMRQLEAQAQEEGEDIDNTDWLMKNLDKGVPALESWLEKHGMGDLWGEHPEQEGIFALQTPFLLGGQDGLGANRIKGENLLSTVLYDIGEGRGEIEPHLKMLGEINATINSWNKKLAKYDDIAQTKGLDDDQQQEKDWVSKKLHVNMAWAGMLTNNLNSFNANLPEGAAPIQFENIPGMNWYNKPDDKSSVHNASLMEYMRKWVDDHGWKTEDTSDGQVRLYPPDSPVNFPDRENAPVLNLEEMKNRISAIEGQKFYKPEGRRGFNATGLRKAGMLDQVLGHFRELHGIPEEHYNPKDPNDIGRAREEAKSGGTFVPPEGGETPPKATPKVFSGGNVVEGDRVGNEDGDTAGEEDTKPEGEQLPLPEAKPGDQFGFGGELGPSKTDPDSMPISSRPESEEPKEVLTPNPTLKREKAIDHLMSNGFGKDEAEQYIGAMDDKEVNSLFSEHMKSRLGNNTSGGVFPPELSRDAAIEQIKANADLMHGQHNYAENHFVGMTDQKILDLFHSTNDKVVDHKNVQAKQDKQLHADNIVHRMQPLPDGADNNVILNRARELVGEHLNNKFSFGDAGKKHWAVLMQDLNTKAQASGVDWESQMNDELQQYDGKQGPMFGSPEHKQMVFQQNMESQKEDGEYDGELDNRYADAVKHEDYHPGEFIRRVPSGRDGGYDVVAHDYADPFTNQPSDFAGQDKRVVGMLDDMRNRTVADSDVTDAAGNQLQSWYHPASGSFVHPQVYQNLRRQMLENNVNPHLASGMYIPDGMRYTNLYEVGEGQDVPKEHALGQGSFWISPTGDLVRLDRNHEEEDGMNAAQAQHEHSPHKIISDWHKRKFDQHQQANPQAMENRRTVTVNTPKSPQAQQAYQQSQQPPPQQPSSAVERFRQRRAGTPSPQQPSFNPEDYMSDREKLNQQFNAIVDSASISPLSALARKVTGQKPLDKYWAGQIDEYKKQDKINELYQRMHREYHGPAPEGMETPQYFGRSQYAKQRLQAEAGYQFPTGDFVPSQQAPQGQTPDQLGPSSGYQQPTAPPKPQLDLEKPWE